MNGCSSIRIFTLGNLAEKHKGEDSKRSRRTLWRRLQATDLPGGQHWPDPCSWTICWRSDVGLMMMMMMIHTHLRALDGARSDQKREWGWIITQGVPLLFCRRHQRHGQQVQQWQHQRQGRGTKKMLKWCFLNCCSFCMFRFGWAGWCKGGGTSLEEEL